MSKIHRYMEEVDLLNLAKEHGTPLYVYSRAAIERQWRAFNDAFGGREHMVCYAVKACSNIAILNILSRLGCGFDIVSGGELSRVIRAGGDPGRVVFSGVGKRRDEIEAALAAGVLGIHVESAAEWRLIDLVAGQCGVTAPVSLRLNPDIATQTHSHTATGHKESKFGISPNEVVELATAAPETIEIVGLSVHIGSQITEMSSFLEAARRVVELADALVEKGVAIRYLDLGGGLGIAYHAEQPPSPSEYVRAMSDVLGDRSYIPLIEPGRAVVGEAGVLLTKVLYTKAAGETNMAVVDAAMNDLMRPSLYDAYHEVVSVAPQDDVEAKTYDIVGPVCETGDSLARNRSLALTEGDLLAVLHAGAYGFSMASTYNSRCRPAEVLVDGDRAYVIRTRDSIEDLIAGERLIP